MSLNYFLTENKVGKPDEFVAHATGQVSRNREDAIKAMTGPGSILKETECRAVLEAFFNTIHGYFQDGDSYRDADLAVYHNMSGTYTSADDRFDPERHAVKPGCALGDRFRTTAATIRPSYRAYDGKSPFIREVHDLIADSKNDALTPNGILEINGHDLKIYDEVEGQGVFFVNQGDNSETGATRIHGNTPSTLDLVVPDLAAGSYKVVVRNTTKQGKELREFIFSAVLTVA